MTFTVHKYIASSRDQTTNPKSMLMANSAVVRRDGTVEETIVAVRVFHLKSSEANTSNS